MSQILFLIFAALIVWGLGRFAFYYMNAIAVGMWPKAIEAAGDSATYFAAKGGMLLSAAVGLLGTGGDFLATTPEAKASFQGWVSTYVTNPTVLGLVGLALMGMIWWARSRTL